MSPATAAPAELCFTVSTVPALLEVPPGEDIIVRADVPVRLGRHLMLSANASHHMRSGEVPRRGLVATALGAERSGSVRVTVDTRPGRFREA